MRLRLVALLAILGIGGSLSAAAYAGSPEAKDGFDVNEIRHSHYFTIYVEEGTDLNDLAVKLAVPPSIKAIIRDIPSSSGGFSFEDQMDILFLAVSEIMDIRLKKFHGEVKICKDAASLSRVATNLFGRSIQPRAFYVVGLDTLYVDADTVTLNVLGHELSHAVQTHYFVVAPPEKIQEVLAGFVEYQLRKYTHTLPNS